MSKAKTFIYRTYRFDESLIDKNYDTSVVLEWDYEAGRGIKFGDIDACKRYLRNVFDKLSIDDKARVQGPTIEISENNSYCITWLLNGFTIIVEFGGYRPGKCPPENIINQIKNVSL